MESRQFDLLLGHVQPDGVRTPGLIDKFNGQGFDASYIIEMVANDSEEKGMFEDSVKLHDLAGNHEKVVELLNKLLAQVNLSSTSTLLKVFFSNENVFLKGCLSTIFTREQA